MLFDCAALGRQTSVADTQFFSIKILVLELGDVRSAPEQLKKQTWIERKQFVDDPSEEDTYLARDSRMAEG